MRAAFHEQKKLTKGSLVLGLGSTYGQPSHRVLNGQPEPVRFLWGQEAFPGILGIYQVNANDRVDFSTGYRHKRKRPMLARWQKFLLGWLHNISSIFTKYTNFRPETLVGWHRRFVKRWWWMLVITGKRRAAGRSRLDASVEQIIIDIKTDNPSYGSKRISLNLFDEGPKIMRMDHDSIFIPLMNRTLPNMGIKVVRTTVGCPWLRNCSIMSSLLAHCISIDC